MQYYCIIWPDLAKHLRAPLPLGTSVPPAPLPSVQTEKTSASPKIPGSGLGNREVCCCLAGCWIWGFSPTSKRHRWLAGGTALGITFSPGAGAGGAGWRGVHRAMTEPGWRETLTPRVASKPGSWPLGKLQVDELVSSTRL